MKKTSLMFALASFITLNSVSAISTEQVFDHVFRGGTAVLGFYLGHMVGELVGKNADHPRVFAKIGAIVGSTAAHVLLADKMINKKTSFEKRLLRGGIVTTALLLANKENTFNQTTLLFTTFADKVAEAVVDN